MIYEIDMKEMRVRSSDGHQRPLDATRRELVELVEPIPGATYWLLDGDEKVQIASWKEFLKLMGAYV